MKPIAEYSVTKEQWFGPVALGIISVLAALNIFFIQRLVTNIDSVTEIVQALRIDVRVLQKQVDRIN